MIKARMAKEAIVRINNRMGVLAQVTKNLADMGLNIEAVIATVEGTDAVIRMVTGDHQRTVDALRDQRLEVQEARGRGRRSGTPARFVAGNYRETGPATH